MKCEGCKWFDADSGRAEATDGVCRRHPPSFVVLEGGRGWDFPEVDREDWCSEFEDVRVLVPVDERGVVRVPTDERGRFITVVDDPHEPVTRVRVVCPTCGEPMEHWSAACDGTSRYAWWEFVCDRHRPIVRHRLRWESSTRPPSM